MIVTTSSGQGAPSSKITDAWVSVNGRFLGVWELPARIPVLAEGVQRVSVVPGIKRNGVYDDRLRYPFLQAWSGEADLVLEQATTIAPSSAYLGTTAFWVESFDDAFTYFSVSDTADELLRFTPEEHPTLVRDGSACGGVRLNEASSSVRLVSDQDFEASSGPSFLEIDLSSDVELVVGVTYTSGGLTRSEPVVITSPTTSNGDSPVWNKVYIDLSALFNTSGISDRDVFIEGNLPNGRSQALFLLDNIKLVRFE